MKLKMIIPGDTKGMETDMEMFSLANIKSKQVLVERYICKILHDLAETRILSSIANG